MLFIAIEAVFFGLAYVSFQTRIKDLKWIAILGVILCIAWIFLCTHGGCIIDQLKSELRTLYEQYENNNLDVRVILRKGR
jgi:hypothetical protein